MRWWAAVPGFVATALLAAVAGTATPAQAYHSTTVYRDPANTSNFRSWVDAVDGNYYGRADELTLNEGGSAASASRAQSIRSGLWKVRAYGGRVLPRLRVLGTIGLVAGSFDLGWQIGRTLDTKWLKFSALASGELGSPVTTGRIRDTSPVEWVWVGTASEWRIRVHSDYGSPCGNTDVFPSGAANLTLVDLFGSDRTACKEFLQDAYTALTTIVGTVGATQVVTCPGTFFGSTYTGDPQTCYRQVETETAMESYFAGKIATFTDYAGQTATVTRSTSGHDPSASAQGFASEAAQDEAAAAQLDAEHDAGAMTAYVVDPQGQPDARVDTLAVPNCDGMTYSQCVAALQAAGHVGTITRTTRGRDTADLAKPANAVLSSTPSYGTAIATDDPVTLDTNPDPLPLLLPQPLVMETTTAYLQRLAALGWTGLNTNTVLTETTGDPRLGTSGVVSVRTASGSYQTAAWPTSAPRIWPDEDVDTFQNPDTFTPVPDEGDTLPPAGECNCPPLDLSPLTELDFGDKFPFGVLFLVGGIVGTLFYAAPDAPRWVFDFDWLGVSEDYVVDLNAFDSYMATIRTLLSWCIWIGGLWWFGTRMLGMRESGDPGAAVDDAWE